ncbi:MAG: hypothetical protein JW741_01325 [Sedimentisphaerales bacterium]|nr:hypothetical protein [Sedimentisphaerales bacterium]
MVRRSPFARLLAWVLVLHCAHMPVPCSDGAEQTAGEQRVEEEEADIDFILLGTDLPDDVDDGPIDDDPERCPTPFGDYFLVVKAGPNGGGSKLLRSAGSGGLRILSPRLALPVSSIQMPASGSVRSFGVSFTISAPQAWRELLSVFLI